MRTSEASARQRLSYPSLVVMIGVTLLLTIVLGLLVRQGVSAAGHDVTIQNFAFSPNSITISPGDTVTWTNNDAVSHRVTADDGSWASSVLGPGQSYTHQFNSAGSVPYHCSIHPSMTATVQVGTSSSPPPTTGGGGISTAVMVGLVGLVAVVVIVSIVLIWRRTRARKPANPG